MVRAGGNKDGEEYLFIGLTNREMKAAKESALRIELKDLKDKFGRLPDSIIFVVAYSQEQLVEMVNKMGTRMS